MTTAVLHGARAGRAPLRAGVLLGVLGVVYGDIGTSPLYALKASLAHFDEGSGVTQAETLGVLSLIFWSLVLVVTVKYVALIMRADNNGEGGILALMALAQRNTRGEAMRSFLMLVGIGGACLFFGDGTITPAISVLSAVEGLKVISPAFDGAVVPLSVVVLVALFLVQYRGTSQMGAVFGPVMALWFSSLGLLGIAEITAAPMAMKIARITRAPMTPQSSTFCWWRLGTANWPRITAKMNRLSTERLFSTR